MVLRVRLRVSNSSGTAQRRSADRHGACGLAAGADAGPDPGADAHGHADRDSRADARGPGELRLRGARSVARAGRRADPGARDPRRAASIATVPGRAHQGRADRGRRADHAALGPCPARRDDRRTLSRPRVSAEGVHRTAGCAPATAVRARAAGWHTAHAANHQARLRRQVHVVRHQTRGGAHATGPVPAPGKREAGAMRVPLTPAPVRVVAARAVVVLGFAAAFALAARPDAVQRARVAPSPSAQPPRLIVPLRSEPASDVTERRERVSGRAVALRERRARARARARSRATAPRRAAARRTGGGPARSAPLGGGAVGRFRQHRSGRLRQHRAGAARVRLAAACRPLPAPSTSGSSGSAAPAPPGSPGGGAPSTSGSPGGGASPTRPASGFDSSGTFESER